MFCVFKDRGTTEIYTYWTTRSLHGALPVYDRATAGDRRDDRLHDVLGAVGGHEQRLGPVGDVEVGRVEQQAAQLDAQRGVAGLEGEQGPEPLRQAAGLGGLAAALAALEGDQAPAHLASSSSGGGGRGRWAA